MAIPTYSTGGPLPFTGGFAAYFPELATADTGQQGWITSMLELEWRRLDVGFWGVDRDEAALLLVAQKYADAYKPAKGRRPSSKSSGRWSKSYEASAGAGSVYKDRYHELMNRRALVERISQ